MAPLLLFFLFGAVFAETDLYKGHTLYKVTAKEYDQARHFNSLDKRMNIDVWSYASLDRPGMVLVGQDEKLAFENEMRASGAELTVKSENITELLEFERMLFDKMPKVNYTLSRAAPLPLDRIHTYDEINAYLDMLGREFPETVSLVVAGKSFENRDIKYLKISTTNFQDRRKPVVFLQSILHAREWVTLPATLYAIQKLVFDITDSDLLNDVDWIISPVANPDGFAFTHNLQNRIWRKNRATGYMTHNFCLGVDLDSNFDFMWGELSTANVCADTFHGASAFSEPESAIIRDIFAEYADRIELFMDFHSYGSNILYGYGSGELPSNGLMLHLLGVQMAQAIDARKTYWNPNYQVGNSAAIHYAASGNCKDYAKIVGVPFSYVLELPRYRNLDEFGFLVDPQFIEQAGMETWEAIKVGARFVRDNTRARL